MTTATQAASTVKDPTTRELVDEIRTAFDRFLAAIESLADARAGNGNIAAHP
jgi:aminoglycoside phosphotransferase family enzyme